MKLVQIGWTQSNDRILEMDRPLEYCADCRNLNAVFVRGSTFNLFMDQCIYSVMMKKIFSTLDVNNNYFQV